MKSLSCPNRQCPLARKASSGNIIGHGFYRTNRGRRRRYRCSTCGKTFCSNTGTPYHRLQHRRATFDEVAALSVEGLNKSAIARVKRISWNTVHRWLQRAAGSCRRFNDRKTTGYAITELQADEIRTIIRRKEQPIWIFATIRGLVAALACDDRGKTKLSKHTHPLPGHLQPNESRTCPSDHH